MSQQKTRKENNAMNEIEKLRNDARSVIAAYKKGDDFDAVVIPRKPIKSQPKMPKPEYLSKK